MSHEEENRTPKCIYNWRIYLSAAVAALAALMIGYDSAFIGGTIDLPSFQDEFGFDKMSDSKVNFISENVVSTYQGGCFFGALLGYPFGQLLGRKKGLCIAGALFVLGTGLQLGANGNRGLTLIYVGRVIAGLGIGAASNLTPIYIAEMAPPMIRGQLVGMYELGWQVGGLVGFWINYGVQQHIPSSHKQWIIPFAIQLIPGGALMLGSLWLRESPRWLLQEGMRDKAVKNLCWFRNLESSHPYMVEEIAEMDASHEERQSKVGFGFFAPFRTIFTSNALMKRLALGVSLFVWQNACGINAVNYYSPKIFESIGITGTSSSLLSTGIFGVIKTVMTLVWMFFLIERLGRRKILMIGAMGGGVCMYAIGAYIAIAQPTEHPSSSITGGGIAAMFFFYMWTLFYTPSWNGTPWVINAEIFDQYIRTLTQAICAASNWLWNFIIARNTLQMFASMGYGVYIFFATLMILSVPYVYFLVPETKGVPLEYTDKLFQKGVSARKAHRRVMEELEGLPHEAIGHDTSKPGEAGEGEVQYFENV